MPELLASGPGTPKKVAQRQLVLRDTKSPVNVGQFAFLMLLAVWGPAFVKVLNAWNTIRGVPGRLLPHQTLKQKSVHWKDEIPAAAEQVAKPPPPSSLTWRASPAASSSSAGGKPFVTGARITHLPGGPKPRAKPAGTHIPAANNRAPLPPLPLPTPVLKGLGAIEGWWAWGIDRTAGAVVTVAGLGGVRLRVKPRP